MDLLPTSFMPGDPRLINQIVYELKSQGIFDQFRKECIADVDTKPAYQNLSQRVEGSVMNFLNKQKFAENINKNQLREQLRKNITESGFLESGVERIVDQVVNPKINSVFLPKVEDVVYRFLGIQRPSQEAPQPETKPPIEDLLPHDLEAISPESVNDQSFNSTQSQSKDDAKAERNDTLNSSDAKTEDESPSFEPLEESTKFSVQEENSVDSHLSGMSGLSHNSRKIHDVDMAIQVEAAQDVSLHSEANLSIITSEEDAKMEICENTTMTAANDHNAEKVSEKKEVVNVQPCGDSTSAPSETAIDKPECKTDKVVNEDNSLDGKKPDTSKGDSKRSHDRHKSSRSDSHKREHKDKRERSKSESKSKDHKEKTSSKHSSTSKDKDKDCANRKEESIETEKAKKEDKDRHKSKSSSSSKSKDNKDRSEKRDKSKEKSEKEEKTHKDKDRTNKEKSDTDKASKSEKSKSSKDKDKSRLEKEQSDKDKSGKSSKDKSSGLLKTENKDKIRSSSKEKGQPSSSIHSSQDKTSIKGSKDKSKSGSTTTSKGKDKKVDGSKSRSTEKHKKSEKTESASHEKNGSSSRKGKEKRTSDDHYSFKDKKGTRRSTDRDSNDGSSKMSRNGSVTEAGSNSYKGSSKESSEVFSSGGGESSNSENVEEKPAGDGVITLPNAEVPPIKYLKPKFASNIHEAMKLMKIRKQLAKLERQNQLALTTVSVDDGEKVEPEVQQDIKFERPKSGTTVDPPDVKSPKLSSKKSNSPLKNMLELQTQLEKQADEAQRAAVDDIPVLKSQDISLESFAALEARLALEMSNVNDRTYAYGEDEDDDIEYSALTTSPVKQRNLSEKQEIYHSLFEESAPNSREAHTDQKPLEASTAEENLDNDCVTSQPSKTRTFILDQNSDEEIELAAGVQSKSRIRDSSSILRTVLLNPEPPASNNEAEFIGFANADREEGILLKLALLVEHIKNQISEIELKGKSFKVSIKSAEQRTYLGCSPCASMKHMNGKKLVVNIEKVEFGLKSAVLPLSSTHVASKAVKPLNGGFEVTNFKQNGQNSGSNQQASSKLRGSPIAQVKNVMEWENEDIPCYFFEKPVTSKISVLNRQIQRLENNIAKQLQKITDSASAIKKQSRKRQLGATGRNIEAKLAAKRSRLNDAILEQNTCSTNVSSHQDFILPLSPAESEKSGEQKKEEPAPVKLRKSTRGSTSQRYSTDDLYKPRPTLGCSGSRRKGTRGDTGGQSQP